MVKSKKGQVTIFVILAIVLLLGIAGYFMLSDVERGVEIPSDLIPVYDYYSSCIESSVIDGASILGTQGGYIELPEFEAGSEYAPFSSQLDFMGTGVPYWYYVSNNGLIKEQIPTVKEMEASLADYVEEKVGECDFTLFEREGFRVELGEASVDTSIEGNVIKAGINQPLTLSRDGSGAVATLSNHNFEVSSRLGGYYELAKEIYDKEKQEAFLENYALDALYAYAPVSGSQVSCEPLFWSPYEVVDDLQNALEANVQAIKINGDYYKATEENNYFIVDLDSKVNEQVNFLYSSDWPSRFEVWPTQGDVMTSSVVAGQDVTAAMGFCITSYKFAYDMFFPVLIQVIGEDGEDIFQFPVATVISKNQVREALAVDPIIEPDESVCDNSNEDVSIYTYNNELNAIEADVEFRCMTDVCELGETDINEAGDAVLETKVPACVNGIMVVNAEGYKEEKYTISTNEESIADILLDREYDLELEIFVDGSLVSNMAILSISENIGEESELVGSVAYPYNRELEVSEGYYSFDLKVFTDQSVIIPESDRKQCVDVPETGLLGLFGQTKEECYDYVVPGQTIPSVLYAGGSVNQYITQSELDGADVIRVFAQSVQLPSKIEDLQVAYDAIEINTLYIEII